MEYKIIGPDAKYVGNCVVCGARTNDILIKDVDGNFAVCCAYHQIKTPMSINKRKKTISAMSGKTFEA